MSSIQVIVAAMNQHDMSLYKRMNVQCNLTIANQTNFTSYSKETIEGNIVEMISTETCGVGINRNLGLQYANDDIILLSDEDTVYYDDYCETVERAFSELPEADVIAFEMEYHENGVMIDRDNFRTRRCRIYNGLSFGACQIAFRKNAVKKSNIYFSTIFGGGCIYSSGEDSKFLVDCFRNKLKVYAYHGAIGVNNRDHSSWFKGYTDKFFYDRGALAACSFPVIKRLICLYYLICYRGCGNQTVRKKYMLMSEGIKGFDSLSVYCGKQQI